MNYQYEKHTNTDVLEKEINQSNIVIALDYIVSTSEETEIFFKTSLSSEEKTILDNIVDLHDSNSLSPQEPLLVSLDSPKDEKNILLTKSEAFANPGGFRFRGVSFKDTIDANTTKDVDYKIEQERWINGGLAIVDNIGDNDVATFQIVDKDNIFGFGAGVVLDEFITNYYIPQDGKLEVKLDYPARIKAGLYIRMKYTSTHSQGCTLKCNLYLHWKAV